MATETILIGAGGFGRETLDIVEAYNFALLSQGHKARGQSIEIIGIADDSPSELNLSRLEARGYHYLGSLDQVLNNSKPKHYLLGIGSPATKRAVSTVIDAAGWTALSLVHPSASVGSQSELHEGVIVCGGVQLSTNVRLGRHVHLNPNSTIGHDTTLGDFVSVNPGGIVSGEVMVGPDTLVGAGSVVLQSVNIGREAIIGAGACVVNEVHQGDTMVGVPAQVLRHGPVANDDFK